jgi:hypothetical protein
VLVVIVPGLVVVDDVGCKGKWLIDMLIDHSALGQETNKAGAVLRRMTVVGRT